VVKTLKIEDGTHLRLSRQGDLKDTFDDVINRLIDIANRENILLLYRFTNKDPPRELYLANPMYFWTEDNYKVFIKLILRSYPEWIDNIIKYITENEDLYKIVKKYRNGKK
jgi:predicted CopG family antitoxin